MNEQVELKPCPFCGGEATSCWNTLGSFQVYCTNDGCFMHENILYGMSTEEQAAAVWNRRARPEKE